MSNTTIINGVSGSGRRSNDSGNTWKVLTIAGVSGVLFGSVAYAAAKAYPATPDTTDEDADNAVDNEIQDTVPFTTDGEVGVATGVTDDMNFSQAFAAARQEVGPGGVFVWHGGVYGTYTADEWNSMSAAEHNAYYSHIDYGHLNPDTSNIAEAQTGSDTTPADDAVVGENEIAQTDTEQVETEEVETEEVETEEVAVAETQVEEEEVVVAEQPATEAEDDGGVTIYEVSHDYSDDTNVAMINVGGQDAVLVDVDNDQVFDVLVADFNNNGEIEDDEIIDISNDDLTVSDLGGFTDGYDGMDTML